MLLSQRVLSLPLFEGAYNISLVQFFEIQPLVCIRQSSFVSAIKVHTFLIKVH